ncbi:histidine kinase [Coraliomargarita algicola]|uniref:Histidine kinase n=1 Tax=Coraliomargarita algicola TaxID=3092156 RepID=A0ABZ0RSP5_9BACT|nr:ATP-binding protein [Coraliomargarita sp. J2-16]WPJ95989.1 histidine kinase [Coraliomargarita sp. J2-16]
MKCLVSSGDAWLAQSIQTSGALESRPYWSPDYLIDQRTSLGLPLQPARSDISSTGIPDFSSVLEVPPTQALVIELDLGQELEVGRLHLFPATPIDGVLIPNFGFARSIEIAFFKEKGDGTAAIRRSWFKRIGKLEPGNNVIRVPTLGKYARWIRITLHELPLHDGQPVVGFGEIHAFNQGVPLVFESVTLSGFPTSADEMKDRLIDLEVDGRRVMLFHDWLQGLERRQQLSRELAAVNKQLTEITTRWQGFWRGLIAALICILILCAVSVTSYTLWQRKRKEAALRERIAMDLHDDIGSRVSAMALGATYIQRLANETAVIEQGGKLRRLAEQMQSALSDVLWFTDSETDTLHQLLSRLESIAEQVVSTEQLELLVTDIDKMPDSKVSVMFKRDTMLIFREMVNNAAKHSGGDLVQVKFVWKKPYLTISVRDNGAGFDIAEVKSKQVDRPQLGISSMARRADRIGARLVIESTLGQGSEIMLRIQL